MRHRTRRLVVQTTIVAIGVALADDFVAEELSFCGSELKDWLYDSSDWAPRGYHVICAGGESRDARHQLWTGGYAAQVPETFMLSEMAEGSISSFREEVQKRTQMKSQKRWRILPWALFDSTGASVQDASQLRGLLLAFEGGRWVWPAIRVGFVRHISLSTEHEQNVNFTMTTISLDPIAISIDDFLDAETVDLVIAKATPQLERSSLASTDGDHRGNANNVRTSSQTWLYPDVHARLRVIADRTAALTRLPRRLQEPFQVLRYNPGQLYEAHWDYFDPRSYQEQPDFLAGLKYRRNRMVTVFWYLSDVAEGGSTFFPRAYGKEAPKDFASCSGPSVSPAKGRVLIFYSLHPNSVLNPAAMHGGCEVKSGTKYAANIWTWNQEEPEQEQAVARAGRSHEL